MAPGRWGTCLWPLACHSSGLLKPCSSSLPQGHQWRLEIPCSGLASLRTLYPALLSRVLHCLGGTELCKGPLFPFQVQGQEGRRGECHFSPSYPLSPFPVPEVEQNLLIGFRCWRQTASAIIWAKIQGITNPATCFRWAGKENCWEDKVNVAELSCQAGLEAAMKAKHRPDSGNYAH